MARGNGPAIRIDIDAWLRDTRGLSPDAYALAMDLVMGVYLPRLAPFTLGRAAEDLNAVLPARRWRSLSVIEALWPKIAPFFVAVGERGWVPSPDYFSVDDAP